MADEPHGLEFWFPQPSLPLLVIAILALGAIVVFGGGQQRQQKKASRLRPAVSATVEFHVGEEVKR